MTLEDDGRFHLREVIGPDEYHEHVDDNAYTNAFARWNLQIAVEVVRRLRASRPERAEQLEASLRINDDVLTHWSDIAARIVLPRGEGGVLEQFEGYFGLTDVDLAELEPRTRSVQAILGIEATNRTQVIKQPDVSDASVLLRSEFDLGALRAQLRLLQPTHRPSVRLVARTGDVGDHRRRGGPPRGGLRALHARRRWPTSTIRVATPATASTAPRVAAPGRPWSWASPG